MLVIFYSLLLLLFPKNTYAYIDPGTGGMLIQIIIGVAAGFFFTIRHYVVKFFRRLFSFFGLNKGKENKKIDKKL
ncbi:MAG: hypothetical protein Q7R75_01450 [bacterium]|nr:hypothetical protein [bacterium]